MAGRGPTAKNFSYDKDTGYAELATRFKGHGASVFVGFLQSSGLHRQKPGDKAEPLTVAQIGAIHEFGSRDGRIPQRSFLGATIDEKDAALRGLVAKLLAKMVDGKIHEVVALGIIGQTVKDWVRAKITKGIKPKLAASTLRSKGADKSTPLIEQGQLIGSITFEVRKGGK